MEVSNVKGVLCGCVIRKFTQREFRIRVDWLLCSLTGVPEEEEVVKDIADFQDVEIRGKIYSMSAVLLGLPPRSHRCKIRGHKVYQGTACRYSGSGTHTSKEHSVENARWRGFAEVLQGTNMAEFEMDEEGKDQGNEREHQIIDTQPGPITQMLRHEESQDGGGEMVKSKGEATEGEKRRAQKRKSLQGRVLRQRV